jgi:hypothetical protein
VERWAFLPDRNKYFKIYHCAKNTYPGKFYRNVRFLLSRKVKKGACAMCVFNSEVFDMQTHKRVEEIEEEYMKYFFFPNIHRITHH